MSGYKPSTATPAEKENEGSGEGPVAIGWTSGVVGAAMATLNKERKKRKRNVRVETGSIVMIFDMRVGIGKKLEGRGGFYIFWRDCEAVPGVVSATIRSSLRR